MEMPDVIYLFRNSNGGLELGPAPDYCDWLVNVTYHHSRVVEALRRENEELKAKINALEMSKIAADTIIDCQQIVMDREQAKLDKVKWQPIETAPKDGTSILVTDGFDVCDAYFRGGDWWQYQCGDDWYSTSINPTHWMPLPDAPEQR